MMSSDERKTKSSDKAKNVVPLPLAGTKREHLETTTPNDQTISVEYGDGNPLPVMTPGQRELYEEYLAKNMSPVSNVNGTLLDRALLIERMTADGFYEAYNDDMEKSKHLLFIYGKEMHLDFERSARLQAIGKLIDPKTEACRRLAQLIEPAGDKTSRNVNGEDEEAYRMRWYNLLKMHGYIGEQQDAIISSFIHHPISMVMRLQLKHMKHCYMHAPTVVQCYALQRWTGDMMGMMDVSKYVRNSFDPVSLASYLATGGGSSAQFLEDILQRNETLTQPSSSIAADLSSADGVTRKPKIWQRLSEFGPALVSGFKVDDGFRGHKPSEHTLSRFSGNVNMSTRTIGHAMVLIALLREESQWILLLQNWWSRMQFLEVTGEYFISSQASLHWPIDRQTDFVRPGISIVRSFYAESEVEGDDDGTLAEVYNDDAHY